MFCFPKDTPLSFHTLRVYMHGNTGFALLDCPCFVVCSN